MSFWVDNLMPPDFDEVSPEELRRLVRLEQMPHTTQQAIDNFIISASAPHWYVERARYLIDSRRKDSRTQGLKDSGPAKRFASEEAEQNSEEVRLMKEIARLRALCFSLEAAAMVSILEGSGKKNN